MFVGYNSFSIVVASLFSFFLAGERRHSYQRHGMLLVVVRSNIKECHERISSTRAYMAATLMGRDAQGNESLSADI